MSDNIPLELQVEIIKWVPVKSLLQFRSVSKEWKAVIDSPNFGDEYCLRHSQPRLLIRYLLFETEEFTLNPADSGPGIQIYEYVSVNDDDKFEHHQISLPKSLNNFRGSRIVGYSHGLFCLYGFDISDTSPMVVLWNPWIRKCVDVPVPNVPLGSYQIVLGFGVNPQTMDPKIVKIVNSYHDPKAHTSVPIPWRVEVFSLSSGTWKTPSCSRNNLPSRNSIRVCWGQVAFDGVIYWLATETGTVNGRFWRNNMIMSFDLSSEGFEEVCLPDNLSRLVINDLSIFKRMESVVVLEMDDTRTYFGVWMMEQGVTKSFTKLFTVMTPGGSLFCRIRGFMKNGEPIVDHGSDALFAYGSYSEPIKDLGIVGDSESFDVNSYMETLLLIDQ